MPQPAVPDHTASSQSVEHASPRRWSNGESPVQSQHQTDIPFTGQCKQHCHTNCLSVEKAEILLVSQSKMCDEAQKRHCT